MKKIHWIMSLLLIFLAMPALAAEPEIIKSFHSRIVVNQDSSIIVTETILVHAAGDQIKRGIYRDFPTIYTNTDGNKYKVGFKVISVKRDGQPEDYHQDSIANGVRVYFGREDYILPEGDYAYEFTYRATNELGFFSDHDELYWNVTGNGWAFPIERASAEVILPAGILTPDIRMAVYSGAMGERGGGNLELASGAVPTFSATKPLSVGEGLTIVVGWPKGFVSMPLSQNKEWLAMFNLMLIGGLIVSVILLLIYYLWAWNKAGRDPEKNAVIAQYEPPRGLSAAACGYAKFGSYRNSFLTATLIAMAISKFLSIEQLAGKWFNKNRYQLNKIGADKMLLEEQAIIAKELFAKSDSIIVDQKSAKQFISANKELDSYLSREKKYIYNAGYIAAGFLISLAFFCALIYFAALTEIEVNGLYVVIYILALLIINLAFVFLLPRNTEDGRKLKDEVDGFRLFLSVTEKDRMNFHNPPEKTPELFEKYLPYALALGVENKWAKQFDEVFARLKEQGIGYVPAWYLGAGMHDFIPSDLTSELSRSFSGAISSASMAPGSSSGFGGGFSGGGGGGGGGGGW